MEVFTYLVRKANMTYKDILELPHSLYLATLKHNYIFDMEQTEEGREYLDKARKFANPRKHADLSAIRSFGGYNAVEKGGENLDV
ncbi:hypothetical protein V7266_12335 [Neobacillus drentensis]|uniref:hypothetical protein n=1 Tax=Neobacillus drentensis TaxID=220684 RepID=UPI002FFE13EE